jgi:DNA-binding NtrC family response regulator
MAIGANAHARKRILFVDDDVELLGGLESSLRRDSGRWEMVFALGGPRALSECRQRPFDAVVSDMRMPEIDGATLLTIIHQESTKTARIMLTGYAEDADLERIRPILHELLNKPCRIATIRDAIDRAIAQIAAEG